MCPSFVYFIHFNAFRSILCSFWDYHLICLHGVWTCQIIDVSSLFSWWLYTYFKLSDNLYYFILRLFCSYLYIASPSLIEMIKQCIGFWTKQCQLHASDCYNAYLSVYMVEYSLQIYMCLVSILFDYRFLHYF